MQVCIVEHLLQILRANAIICFSTESTQWDRESCFAFFCENFDKEKIQE